MFYDKALTADDVYKRILKEEEEKKKAAEEKRMEATEKREGLKEIASNKGKR